MLLDPVNSVTSVGFYKKVASQAVGRTFAYLFYLAAIFSVVATFAMKIKLGPFIDETFGWLAQSVPPMTFEGGKLTSNLTAPLTIRHPEMADIAVTIDTTRTQPVTLDMLEQNKAMAYVTQNAFYMTRESGRLEVYDFSKTPEPKPVLINADFYQSADKVLQRVLYPVSLIVIFCIFLVWKTLAALFYSLLALAVNAISSGGLDYKSLFNISFYAQTLVIVLQMIFLFLPVGLPAPTIVAPIATGIYIWLGIRRASPQRPAAA